MTHSPLKRKSHADLQKRNDLFGKVFALMCPLRNALAEQRLEKFQAITQRNLCGKSKNFIPRGLKTTVMVKNSVWFFDPCVTSLVTLFVGSLWCF
jgi:hypothetical protein